MPDKIFGLPKNIFFLGLTSLCNDFSSEMVFSVFPAFFTAVLRTGAASLGLVDGIAEAAANFFKIYSGNLSDRARSRKPLVVFGYTLSVATRFFYIFVSTVGGALGLRFLDRVGKGFRDAPRDAIVSLSSPREQLGKSFGYHRAMDTTGAILGPFAAYLILRAFPLQFNNVFLTAFAVGLLSVVTLFFISDVAAPSAPRRGALGAAFVLLSPRFKFFLLSILVLSAGSLPVAVILLKTESLRLALADIPLFYLCYNLSYAALAMPAGKLSDRFGARTIIVIGYVVLLASYAALAFAESAWALAGAFFVFGLFPALTDGVGRSLTAQLTDASVRGGALGWFNAAVGFGALVAGIGGGFLWQTFSPAAAFMVAGSIVLVGLASFVASSR